MLEKLKNLFSSNEPEYFIVTVEFNMYGWKRKPIIRSQGHKGKKVNNQFVQLNVEVNDKSTLYDDVLKIVKKNFPKSSNHRIVDIIKL